jgi:hypothetical protein
VKISKTEYAVFVYYKLESKCKKSNKFEKVMVQNKKKNVLLVKLKFNVCKNNFKKLETEKREQNKKINDFWFPFMLFEAKKE